MQRCSTGLTTRRIELLVHLVNVKQSQSNVGRHRLEVLKEFGMRTGSILFCVKIGFERPVLQRDVKRHIIGKKKQWREEESLSVQQFLGCRNSCEFENVT